MFLFIFCYRTTFGVDAPVFVSEKQQQNKSLTNHKTTAKRYEHSITELQQKQNYSFKSICCNGRNQKSDWPAQSHLEESSNLSMKFLKSFFRCFLCIELFLLHHL